MATGRSGIVAGVGDPEGRFVAGFGVSSGFSESQEEPGLMRGFGIAEDFGHGQDEVSIEREVEGGGEATEFGALGFGGSNRGGGSPLEFDGDAGVIGIGIASGQDDEVDAFGGCFDGGGGCPSAGFEDEGMAVESGLGGEHHGLVSFPFEEFPEFSVAEAWEVRGMLGPECGGVCRGEAEHADFKVERVGAGIVEDVEQGGDFLVRGGGVVDDEVVSDNAQGGVTAAGGPGLGSDFAGDEGGEVFGVGGPGVIGSEMIGDRKVLGVLALAKGVSLDVRERSHEFGEVVGADGPHAFQMGAGGDDDDPVGERPGDGIVGGSE